MLEIVVPGNLDEVVAAIGDITQDPAAAYEVALDRLDQIVAEQCALPAEHRDYMIEQMKVDPLQNATNAGAAWPENPELCG